MQKEFSSALTHAPPSLTSFTLTKVYKSYDEELTRSAARIVSENPGLKNFTLRTTQGSWFSYNESGGRVRGLGVYEVATGFEDCNAENGLSFEGDFVSISQLESPPSSPRSSSSRDSASPKRTRTRGSRRCSIDAPPSADTMAGYRASNLLEAQKNNTAPVASAIPIPIAVIVHEWGQKSGLMGKELARHFVYKLTEKEVEICRSQMRSLVRKKQVVATISRSFSMASNSPMTSMSRRSSSASSMGTWQMQGYAYASGRKNGQVLSLSTSRAKQGRGHKHSSSMSSVVGAANGMDQAYGFAGYAPRSLGYKYSSSVTWADQYGGSVGVTLKDDINRNKSSRKALAEEFVIF